MQSINKKEIIVRCSPAFLFYEWYKTQVEAAALWSAGFIVCLCIYNSNLFSLLSHFDFLYLSFKGFLQTFCLLLSEIAFLFSKKSDNISPGSAVSDSVSPCTLQKLHRNSNSNYRRCGLAKGQLVVTTQAHQDITALQPAHTLIDCTCEDASSEWATEAA